MTDTQERRPPLTPDEAARMLGLDKVSKRPAAMVLDLCRQHKLRKIKVGRFVFVDPDSVDEMLGTTDE